MKDSRMTLVRRLDAAHAALVEARKIAALSKHESYEDIGDAIDCVEAAIMRDAQTSDERPMKPSPKASGWTRINRTRSNLPKTGFVLAGSYRDGKWSTSSISHGDGYPRWADEDRTHFYRLSGPLPPPPAMNNEHPTQNTMNPPAQQHSATSIAAAMSIADRVNRLQSEILAFLRERPNGATDDDMQAELGMQGSTQRPRRIELVAKGLVQAAPERRKTKSGRMATVWVAAK